MHNNLLTEIIDRTPARYIKRRAMVVALCPLGRCGLPLRPGRGWFAARPARCAADATLRKPGQGPPRPVHRASPLRTWQPGLSSPRSKPDEKA
jgi:hypothetical protein